VHESWLSSLESSPESHVLSLESLLFLGAETWVESRVISLESRVISLESESSRVIAKVSRVIIAHWSCQRNYKCTQDSKLTLEMLCNGTMSEFIKEKISEMITLDYKITSIFQHADDRQPISKYYNKLQYKTDSTSHSRRVASHNVQSPESNPSHTGVETRVVTSHQNVTWVATRKSTALQIQYYNIVIYNCIRFPRCSRLLLVLCRVSRKV